MFRPERALIAAWLCVAGSVVDAGPQTQREAAGHFTRGETAQAQGRYEDAIAEYQRAYALVPHANALFNIAVCYERLSDWQRSVEFYQRYLDDGPASDADEVGDKIRGLRAKIEPVGVAPRDSSSTSLPPPPPPATPLPLRWHGGVSYGIGFGDAPIERYLAHAGRQFAGRFDLDAIIGSFGRNDQAFGVVARMVLVRANRFAPFARGALTLGYAKQDSSSAAEMRFPIGIEAGGGVEFGTGGRFELFAATRWLHGGWDAVATTADSYVNDAFTVTIDLGISFDFGAIGSIGRSSSP